MTRDEDKLWPWNIRLLHKAPGLCDEVGIIKHRTRKAAEEAAEAWIGDSRSRTAWLCKGGKSVAIKRGQKPWRKDD